MLSPNYQEILTDIRLKVFSAEEQLRQEKKNLFKADELFSEDKEKWAKEIKAEQAIITANEKELKKKEARVEELKAEYDEVLKKCTELEAENARLEKEIAKAKKAQGDETRKYFIEIDLLEKELTQVEDQMRDIKAGNKWAKTFQDKELKALEVENESKVREEIRELTDELNKKSDAFEENLQDLQKCSIKPREQKIAETQLALEQINREIEDYKKKNKELEEQIEALKKLPTI